MDKIEKIDEKKVVKITGCICAAISLASLVLFIPSVQDMIISFGEKCAGKPLNTTVWRDILMNYSFLFICFPALAVCFVKFLVPFLNEKRETCSTILIILVVLSAVDTVLLYARSFPWNDFMGQTRLCAYALRGENPFLLAGNPTAKIESLGLVPSHFSTTPWGLLLGNVFYPGVPNSFIVFARVWFLILNFSSIIFVAYSLLIKLKEKKIHIRFGIPMLALTSFTFWHALHQGNAGGIICCFVILAILWHEEYPILSGIALAFAMVKPQISALICLSFLLQRKYKPLLIAAAIDILAWLIVSILVKTSPAQLVKDFLSVATIETASNSKGVASIFSGLFPDATILPLSMFLGIVFVILFHFLLKNRDSMLHIFFPACVASSFWSYAYHNDRFILFIPIMLSIFFLFEAHSLKNQILWALSALCFNVVRIEFGTRFITRIFHLTIEANRLTEVLTSAYEILLIAISVIILIKLNRNAKTDSPRI